MLQGSLDDFSDKTAVMTTVKINLILVFPIRYLHLLKTSSRRYGCSTTIILFCKDFMHLHALLHRRNHGVHERLQLQK